MFTSFFRFVLQSAGGSGDNPLDFIARCYYSLTMLTNDDLTKIKLIVTSGNSQVLKEIDEVKEKIENVESQIKLIPSKEEFFGAMSELMGEVKSSKEEQTVISGQLSESQDRLDQHETRLSSLEKKDTFSPPPT